jgi:hypothetical protein
VAAQPLFAPIPVKYTGLYSDDHVIDLQEFGVSLQGLARVSNSIVDFYLHQRVAKDTRLYTVRLFAKPPEPGCVLLDIVGLMLAGQLPLYTPYVCDLATTFIVPLIKATIAKRLKRTDAMEKAIEQITTLAIRHADSMDQVRADHMRDKGWLQSHIDKLSSQNSTPLRQLVRPVGSTCRQIEVGQPDGVAPVTIGEAEAQVLTSREELSVEDSREYHGTFDGVDKTNGNCKFRVAGTDNDIPGKITDPALLNAPNVYTHSLDTQKPITIQAKAVTKDGEIVRLFISDGKRG